MTQPDYLLIGHITHDETPHGPRIGGTVSYAGGAALAMGARVAAVSSIRADDPVLPSLPPALQLARVESLTSSVFVNEYIGDKRKQILKSRATPLSLADVPLEWRSAPIIHLCPLTDEVDPALATAFSGALVAATPQGWMRAWDADGVISPKPWAHADQLLPQLSVTVLSEEDIHRDTALEAHYAALAPLLVVTRAANGCTVYQHSKPFDVPAPQVEVVDATGAGDVFTGVFLVMLYRTGDIRRAAAAATELASASVTRVGLEGIPTKTEIDALLSV